ETLDGGTGGRAGAMRPLSDTTDDGTFPTLEISEEPRGSVGFVIRLAGDGIVPRAAFSPVSGVDRSDWSETTDAWVWSSPDGTTQPGPLPCQATCPHLARQRLGRPARRAERRHSAGPAGRLQPRWRGDGRSSRLGTKDSGREALCC